ncbi:MAG: hypothetical protein ABIR54_13910 [Burkholderiaceae bacterium]
MQIVLIGWAYVVVLMAAVEAFGPNGSVLGALVTLLLWGVLPLTIILYIGGARARARMRALREAQRSRDVDPGGGGQPTGDAVTPVREEA